MATGKGLLIHKSRKSGPSRGANFFVNPEKITIPAGESFSELQQRGLTAIEEIVDTHPGETVLIAAHGAIIRTILAEALHMPLQYIWSLRQDNTAVNIIRYDDKNSFARWSCLTAPHICKNKQPGELSRQIFRQMSGDLAGIAVHLSKYTELDLNLKLGDDSW